MQRPTWVYKLKFYVKPDNIKSIYQLCNSVIPHLALLITLMLLLKNGVSYWFIMIFIPLSSLFQVRTFILMHDCSHRSFLKSERICAIIGHFLGLLSFTAFFDWRKAHMVHHATVGNLEKRGVGDIKTMTVDEYLKASRWERIFYRIYRNPLVLFGIGPILVFIFSYRFPQKSSGKKEIFSIMLTNVLLIMIIIISYYTVGIKNYLVVQIPVFYIAGAFGVWLFYVQHQFEDVYWAHNDKWNIYTAAMEGSSYYKLPSILQWFTGNIGFHNIHHLNPRIPNYNLMKCYNDMPEMVDTITIKMIQGFSSLFLNIWDEKRRKLINFSEIKAD